MSEQSDRFNGQLKVIREQLARIESALESIRRDVLPKNGKLFHLMAEPYIDTIVELKSQIDVYLNAQSATDSISNKTMGDL